MKAGNKTTNGHSSEPLHIFEEAVRSFRKKTSGFKGKTVEELSDELKAYVREHPLKSLLMATGIGLLLGLFFRRNK